MPVKVEDNTGKGTFQNIGDGIRWAADNGANIISLSVHVLDASGNEPDSTYVSDRVQWAWNKGCLLIVAAGNHGTTALEYPAAYPNVISVAASDSTDTLAGFSEYGSWVSVAAPGGAGADISHPTVSEEILSTEVFQRYGYDFGTSFAAPHVAGEAALIWSRNPALNNYQVKNLIINNVETVNPYAGHTIGPGGAGGRVNALSALAKHLRLQLETRGSGGF